MITINWRNFILFFLDFRFLFLFYFFFDFPRAHAGTDRIPSIMSSPLAVIQHAIREGIQEISRKRKLEQVETESKRCRNERKCLVIW
jgi:hypothetical protein